MSSDQQVFLEKCNVSRETLERLDIYHQLLLKWTPRINLVSRSTLTHAWTRHFLDSAQIFEIAPEGAQRWADLGSGGGFPGAVLAILARERSPETRFTLVEADQRKATFLRTVARETGVNMDIVVSRIETAKPCGANIISARALAPLTTLLSMAERHLDPSGVAIFPKGKMFRDEVAEALESFSFDCEEYPSETDSEAVILKIGGISRGT